MPDAVEDPAAERPSGVKARVEAVRTRVEQTRDQIEAARPNSRVIETAMSTFERETSSGGAVLAGAVAFRVFMFLVPYAFTLVVGFGVAAEATDQSPREVARSAGIGGLTAQAVASVSFDSFGQRLFAFGVGLVALFLGAKAAVKVLHAVHALIWGRPLTKLPKPTKAAIAFILIVSAGLGAVAVIDGLRAESAAAGYLLMGLYTTVPIGIWLFVTAHLPRAEAASWRELLPGALVFGVGVQLMHVFTVVWIAHQVSSKTDTYGAIGAALALLLWAYLMGRIVTLSASLNFTRWIAAHPEQADHLPRIELG